MGDTVRVSLHALGEALCTQKLLDCVKDDAEDGGACMVGIDLSQKSEGALFDSKSASSVRHDGSSLHAVGVVWGPKRVVAAAQRQEDLEVWLPLQIKTTFGLQEEQTARWCLQAWTDGTAWKRYKVRQIYERLSGPEQS
jgi:hypothetical protein